MTQIHVTDKVLRLIISVIGFPLACIQTVLSKYALHKYKLPGEKIIVSSTRSLHAIVTGKGETTCPTVILESGMGGCSLDWSLVQPELSKHTTVISYDRAGFGWSTQTIKQPTCKNYVNDLRILLSRSELKPPYLLVGHSYGGMIMRLFASLYPDEVMGIILVDSTHEKRYLESHLSEVRRLERKKYQKKLRLGYLLSPIAVPRMLKQHIGSKRLPPTIQKIAVALGYRNNSYKAAYLEFLCTKESAVQLHTSLPLRSDMPLIVLTAGRQSKEWKEGQKELVNLSKKTQQIIIEDSWHSIPVHNPQAVVDSVVKLLDSYGA